MHHAGSTLIYVPPPLSGEVAFKRPLDRHVDPAAASPPRQARTHAGARDGVQAARARARARSPRKPDLSRPSLARLVPPRPSALPLLLARKR
jgi:hypothetical protein